MSELQLVSPPTDSLDGPAAGHADALRAYFETGATKPLSWRLAQLYAL